MTTKRTPTKQLTPRLDALLVAGTVMTDGFGQYIGLASDGQWVQIGSADAPARVEAYLSSHPSPQDW